MLTDELMQSIVAALNKYLLALAKKQIYLSFEQSEKEVTDLHQRTKEGIQTARLNGKQIGQKQGAKLTTKKSIAAKKEILKHSKDFSGTLSDMDTMKLGRPEPQYLLQVQKRIEAGQLSSASFLYVGGCFWLAVCHSDGFASSTPIPRSPSHVILHDK